MTNEFYHGSGIKIKNIDLNRGNNRTDFGKGFYVGNNLGVARTWALRKSSGSQTPSVTRFYIDQRIFNPNLRNTLGINIKVFLNPDIEWLDFVKENRRRRRSNELPKEPRHAYDIVYGPIADDKANDVVEDYIEGKLTAEQALRKIKVINSVFQFSFHTSISLNFIALLSPAYQERSKNGSWSAWKLK